MKYLIATLGCHLILNRLLVSNEFLSSISVRKDEFNKDTLFNIMVDYTLYRLQTTDTGLTTRTRLGINLAK